MVDDGVRLLVSSPNGSLQPNVLPGKSAGPMSFV